ncbi:hypothetical protein B0H13DRAFT_1917070 [Mycena leptocephala]|nr:hypothetical protein B0H13DRAFT_1917070 [Mycena leptocephala]
MVAIAERGRQVVAWKEVNKSIPADVRANWQARVDAFLEDRTKPNPYELITKVRVLTQAEEGPTEAEIHVMLKKDEEAAAAKGLTPVHGTSATAFLTAGLQLEDTQLHIKAEISGMTIITADWESKIQEHQLALHAKLSIRAVERQERSRNPEAPAVEAENIRLFLPSELTEVERSMRQEGLLGMEAKLRKALCTDALHHVLYWKSSNTSGQARATKSQTLAGQIGDCINATANKYHDARRALQSLKGPNYALHLKPLKLRGRSSLIAAGKHSRTPRHIAGTSKTVLSWIWAACGALDDEERHLHDSLRVEWANAKARKNQWEEEVKMAWEEMRHIMGYLEFEVGSWTVCAASTEEQALPPATRMGLKAYALKEAALHGDLHAFYYNELNVSLGDAAAASMLDVVDGEDMHTLFEEGDTGSAAVARDGVSYQLSMLLCPMCRRHEEGIGHRAEVSGIRKLGA